MTLRLRVVLFTLAILLPAIAGGAWVVATNVARERTAIQTRVRETTRALSLVVDRELERRAAIVQVLAASPQIQDLDFAGFCRLARASVTGRHGPIALLDNERQYVNTATPDCVIPAERRIVQPKQFTADALLLSDMFVGSVTHELITVLNAPVTVRGHLYNVALAIRPDELQQILVDQNLPSNWVASVVNKQGRVVARQPDPQRWIGVYVGADVHARMLGAREGEFPGQNLLGQSTMEFFSTTSRFGMAFFTSLPRAVLDGNRLRSMLEVTLGATLLLLLGGLIAVWIGRKAAQPIEGLQLAAADLEAGRKVSVPRTGIEELDQVGNALARASERIRASSHAMERRVAEAVAEVQATQARLVQSQKLEVIGRLTGGISHDFNNLLQTLSTGLHVLEQMVQDARARPLIDAGLRAVNRAARLVQQLLSFGRHASLTRQPIDFRNQLLSMETLLTKALPASIVLRTDLAPDLWPIDTDASQLEVALLNLIFNARDAMGEGGVITVKARNQSDAEGEYVVIAVTDTGRGIEPEVLPQIFDPFFTTKPVGQGTGLGLAQVHAFAQDSGGTVSATSEPARGTTLTLRLPRSTRAVPADEGEPEAVSLLRPCTLLFVEDDVMVAEVVDSALTGAGFKVVHARSGDQALAQLRGGLRVDVVFSDVVMPGSINGIELAQLVAREFPGLPVVLASGYAGSEIGEPAVTLLAKPYSIQTLIRTLAEALPAHD